MLKPAIHLVGEEDEIVRTRKLDDGGERVGGQLRPRGVVRAVDVEELGLGPDRLFERIEVVGPTVGVTTLPLRDPAPVERATVSADA